MCMSTPKAPTPPPAMAEAPRAPDTSGQGGTPDDRDRRRRATAAGTATGGTILTGPRGTTGQAATTQKTLLGA